MSTIMQSGSRTIRLPECNTIHKFAHAEHDYHIGGICNNTTIAHDVAETNIHSFPGTKCKVLNSGHFSAVNTVPGVAALL